MVVTLEALEKLINSEVENLHIRIDSEVASRFSRIETSLDSIFLQLQLLWNKIDKIDVIDARLLAVEGVLASKADKSDIEELRKDMATKSDIKAIYDAMATKSDLESMRRSIIDEVVERVATILK